MMSESSGLKFATRQDARAPLRVVTSSPERLCHSLTVLSAPADANVVPVELLKATLQQDPVVRGKGGGRAGVRGKGG